MFSSGRMGGAGRQVPVLWMRVPSGVALDRLPSLLLGLLDRL